MSDLTHDLGLNLNLIQLSPTHGCYRPPSWPPPSDWAVSMDGQGNPLSVWGGPSWDFTALAGKTFKLDFAGGRHGRSAKPLCPENQHVMRMLATWILWGHQAARTWDSVTNRFNFLRRILALCEQEGVLASDLMRFPRVLERLPDHFSTTRGQQYILVELERVLRAKDRLGFTLVDAKGIGFLSRAFANRSNKESEQTAYVPPRIWTYQLLRLRECLDDFLLHRQQVEDCFYFCVNAYVHNYGSLEAALLINGSSFDTCLPFTEHGKGAGKRTGRRFHGPFVLTAQRFGIKELIERWVLPARGSFGLQSLSALLTMVQLVGLTYIAFFTLQRKEEVGTLRADCLTWVEEPGLGHIPVIRGKTTKTESDSDAWWPTSPSVEVAVSAMSAVARMRMHCAASNPMVSCNDTDINNPYLFHTAFEPWACSPGDWKPYATRPIVQPYRLLMERYPRLFDPNRLRITEDDLTKARMFTPNLDKRGKFRVGEIWPLAYHQLRRTGAINMFASGLLSESSIQVILKHMVLSQTVYYGRNHTRLRFSEEFEGLMVTAKYEVMARQIEALVSERYVSPLGQQHKNELVINLIGSRDFKALVKAGKKGEVSFRETRLGACTKVGTCDYGGIESVARCAGGDGDEPCREAFFDRTMKASVERQLARAEEGAKNAQQDSPRERAMLADAQGMRNYLNVIEA